MPILPLSMSLMEVTTGIVGCSYLGRNFLAQFGTSFILLHLARNE